MTRNCLRPLATIVILALPAAGATIALQSFEESGDTWTYTPDPPEFHTKGDTWGVTNTLLTLSATDGMAFWGINDLNAPNGTNGFGTLTFTPHDVAGYSDVLVSFDFEAFEFDDGDDIKYEVFSDGQSLGEVVIVNGSSNLSTNGTITVAVAADVSRVGLVLHVKQDAQADAGMLDNVRLSGTRTGVIAPVVSVPHTNTLAFTLAWPDDAFAVEYRVDAGTNANWGVIASELFISEYIEGASGFEKAVELFNGTPSTVDLADYDIRVAANGKPWLDATVIPLTGMLDPGRAYVVTHTSASFSNLLSAADAASGSLLHNGNDAIGLFRAVMGTPVLIDAIGEGGTDPGTGNGWDVAGVSDATADHILRRKADVDGPTTNWVTSAGTTPLNSQWEVLDPTDPNCRGFGQHDAPPPNYLAGYANRQVLTSSLTVQVPHAGATYYFRVHSVASDGQTASSATGSITTPSAPPPTLITIR